MHNPSPANGLVSRTFLGLLAAQFLAAFNDQAIHAAAMFFAINTQVLTEENAITLMPILFYAPWAIFCTIAGYFADKYSKRSTLVFWKIAEVGITAVALLGFYLGRTSDPSLGAWLVLGCVFLMGTHSAFFVPAKYGVMPEILHADQLAKGNGFLESLSFLAVILGTVSGGVLSYLFLRSEWIIGAVLLGLAIVGAVASALIRRMPAANPERSFPAYIYGPLVANIRTLYGIPALRLVLQGLVFFTFVVAFMRAAVYMLGESQNPRWDELKTSAVVGTVALGIGLGSPLAGYLSGRRIDLRLVLFGAVGMIACLLAGAAFIDRVPVLVACIIGIGFCTGFYIVPLFTLLQHKAPKGNKGDLIATSNFVNTTGAILATVTFKLVVVVAHTSGLTPPVTGDQRQTVIAGTLTVLELEQGRAVYFEVRDDAGTITSGGRRANLEPQSFSTLIHHILEPEVQGAVLELHRDVPVKLSEDKPFRVEVSKFEIGSVMHYDLVPAGVTPAPDFDNRHLPRFLFVGAAALTGGVLLLIFGPIRRLMKTGI